MTDRIDQRSAKLDGVGFVFWNPDSGEEYSSDHPVAAGTCGDAERIRRSTGQEDCLHAAMQAHWQAAQEAKQALAAVTADRDAQRGRAARAERERDEAVRQLCAAVEPLIGHYDPASWADQPDHQMTGWRISHGQMRTIRAAALAARTGAGPMASERDAPAAGGTGGAATEAEVEAVAAHLRFRSYERACRDMRHAVTLEAEVRALREEVGRLTRERDRLLKFVGFVRVWIHRQTPPNAVNPITDDMRLEAIQHHPMLNDTDACLAGLAQVSAEADAARAREERDAARAGKAHRTREREKHGVRLAIAWLHGRAWKMVDSHARQVLNSAATNLGWDLARDAVLVDQTPTSAGSASADNGMQSAATPTRAGDRHGRG